MWYSVLVDIFMYGDIESKNLKITAAMESDHNCFYVILSRHIYIL